MFNNKNTLYRDKYIISQQLHKALDEERLNKDRKVSENLGIYLVAVRLLNNDKGTIIYNYIYYPEIFLETFITYVITRNINSSRYNEWGDTFFIINKDVFFKNHNFNKFDIKDGDYSRFMFSDLSDLNKYFDSIKQYYSSSITTSLINLINSLTYITLNMDELINILKLSVNKDYKKYIGTILKPFIDSKLFNLDDIDNEQDINLLNCNLFIVNDINTFKNAAKTYNYDINEGPQKWRGQINSMSGLLSSIDSDYRNSLYYHNNYHVRFGQVDTNYALPKSKFSFRNIHMNLGNVRWYSTKITRSTVKKRLIDRLNSQSFKTDSIIYLYLSRFLKESPLNENTERELENFLLEFSYRKLSTKDNSKFNFLSDIGIKKLLIDSIETLNDYINNFMKKSFNIKTKRPSQNTISRYHLQLMLTEIGNNFIVELSLGIISRIISNFNKLDEDSIAVNIFNDIGNILISKYFYTLYRKHILEGTEILINKCTSYIESKDCTLSISDKDSILNLVENLNKNKHKLEVYELFYEINKILSIDNIKNINLNNSELISQYTLSDWKNDHKDIVDFYNETTLRNNIGAVIVEWWNEAELIQQSTVTIGKNERRNYIFPSQNITKILNVNKDHSIKHLPLRIPMIVKPKLYTREIINGNLKERLGGYLLNDEKVTDHMIIPNWELNKPSIIKSTNVIYNLVNNVNSVGFKINVDMLNFIYDYGDKFNLLLEDINLDVVKPRITKAEYSELESYISRLDLQENILGLAKVYSDIPEFYLPVRIDYRGRMNCVSQYLNYQSTELAKSLLLFSKGEKLMKNDTVGINYFKAYGANCFGNKLDKKSWLDRSKWIDDNEQDILNYTNGKLISKADNKLLFISFCIEFCKWIDSYNNIETSYFTTHLPIQLDASCNGYQHLSLLTSDYDMAKELNLTKSSWKDIPKDYYGFLAIKLNDLFKNKLNDSQLSEQDKDCYRRLNNVLITRGTIKKAIMTIPYNVSTHQMISYLKENFNRININDSKSIWSPYLLEYEYKEDTDVILCAKDITFIATGLREVLEANFPKLKLLVMYLKDIASICNKLNLIIPWGTSSGLLVNQSYMDSKDVKLRPFSYSKSSFILKVSTNKLNTTKQVRAFMPNLVHSLDAASLALLAEHYFNGDQSKNFYAIHDCFAVTANNVDMLIKYLKLVYIKIYTEDHYLRNLDKEIIQHIKYHYSPDSFNDDTLEIKINDMTLKYPNINYVLGNKLPSPDLIIDSSYLIT